LLIYESSSYELKCLHGGFRVHFGHLPFIANEPFMVKAFDFISVILYCSVR